MDGKAATCVRCGATLEPGGDACAACGAVSPSGREATVAVPQPVSMLPVGFTTADTQRKVSGDVPVDPAAEITDDGGIEADARFKVGDRMLGHYSVVKQLGRGGMGTVYLARDDVSGQEVAVKVLPASLARERDIRERFIQEARALASMDHPNIVPLVTFSQEGEDRFLVMKYLQGEPLDARLRRLGVLPPEHARKVLRAVLSALGYAHARGVIHRDVKPSNVVIEGDLDGEHRVFLVDFGIAKKDESDRKRLTQTGMLMGTPQYMSPEQISGQPVDGRSDLYAAGLVLFEMLAGRPPFDGQKTFQVLRMHVEMAVPDVQEVRGGRIADDLVAITYLLLRKDPDERPRDATEAIGLLDGTGSFPTLKPDEQRSTPSTASVAPPALPSWPPQAKTAPDRSAAVTAALTRQQLDQSLDDPSMEEIAAVRSRGRGALFAAALVVIGGTVGGLTVYKPWLHENDVASVVDSGSSAADHDHDVDSAAMMLLMQSVRTNLKNNDAKDAFNAVEAVVEKMPQDPEARSLQVDVRTAMGMLDDAEAALGALKAIVAANPAVDTAIKARIPDQQAAIDKKRDQKRIDDAAKVKPPDPPPAPPLPPRPHVESKAPPVSDAQVMKAAQTTRSAVSACYSEHVQGKDPKASGELTVTVRIIPSGKVDSAKVTNAHGGRLFDAASFHKCIEAEIKKWKFASWKGEPTTVPYTMTFRPTK